MGNRTVHFCDFCKKEFGAPGTGDEPMRVAELRGLKYCDASGSTDFNTIPLEMHGQCWRRLFDGLLRQVKNG